MNIIYFKDHRWPLHTVFFNLSVTYSCVIEVHIFYAGILCIINVCGLALVNLSGAGSFLLWHTSPFSAGARLSSMWLERNQHYFRAECFVCTSTGKIDVSSMMFIPGFVFSFSLFFLYPVLFSHHIVKFTVWR